jgi:hypothetical protein
MFELLAGVSEALGDRNQDLLLCAPKHNDADAFQNILWSRGADGFIVLGQGHREDMLNDFAITVWHPASAGDTEGRRIRACARLNVSIVEECSDNSCCYECSTKACNRSENADCNKSLTLSG